MPDLNNQHIQEILANLRELGSRVDEESFNIGIEYGRYLQKENIDNQRLDYFVQRENTNNQFDAKRELIHELRQQVGLLLFNAITDATAQGFLVNFEINELEETAKFPKVVSERYKIQHLYSEEMEGRASFDLAFELTNELKVLFEQAKTKSTIKYFVATLTLPVNHKQLKAELLNSGRLAITARHCPMSVHELHSIVKAVKEHVSNVCTQ